MYEIELCKRHCKTMHDTMLKSEWFLSWMLGFGKQHKSDYIYFDQNWHQLCEGAA